MEAHEIKFNQTVSVGCGIDVHKAIISATIYKGHNDYQFREFDAFTSSLTALRDWCKQEGVTHVAMESTGVYWKPVFNILEEDFEVILVNARHVKNVPGQKTDKKDSKWLAKLLLAGLLKASFIPPADIRELRDSVRYHQSQVQEVSREKNRAIKILEDANIKLSMVLTDVHGSSGTKIIRDIANGITDPNELLKHVHGNVKKSKEEIRKALEGRVTDHHRFMLKLILDGIVARERHIAILDKHIDQQVAKYDTEIQLLQTIDGVGKDSAISIISEIGVNMNQFHNEQALSSWAGLCPGSNESAGKKKSVRTPKGNSRLKSCLTQCAWGATRKKDSYLRAKYYDMIKHKGKKKALVAIARKLLVAAYFVIKRKEAYKEPAIKEISREKQIQKHLKKLAELGLEFKAA